MRQLNLRAEANNEYLLQFFSRISREFFTKIFTACCYVHVGIDDDNPDELVVCTSTYTDKYTFYFSEVELRDLNTDTK